MINSRAQRGMSYWSVMFGLMLGVLVIKAALITWPAYWDNRLINDSITEKLRSSSNADPARFLTELESQLSRNNIRDVKPKDIMQVSTDNSNLIVDTNYEVRQKFMGNMDLVISFKKRFDQRTIKAGN